LNEGAERARGIFNGGTATINNSTISGNTAQYGTGGIDLLYETATIQNSIVADNSGGTAAAL